MTRGIPAPASPPASPPAPSPASSPAPSPSEAPRLRRCDLHRLSEGANGLNLWGYVTAHSLSQVLAPGYFAPAAGWLVRHDRILVTAAAESRRPAHATLVVAATPARGPRVQRLRA